MKPHSRSLLTTAALARTVPLWLAGAAQAATVTISCGSVGQDYENCKALTAEWARKTGHEVKIGRASCRERV